jgi:WD40 repeat protein
VGGGIRVCAADGSEKKLIETAEGTVAAGALSRDGRTLYSASAAGAVSARDLSTGQAVPGSAFAPGRQILSMALTPDGRYLIAGDVVRILIYDARTGKRVGRLTAPRGYAIALSPDGRYLASASGQGELSIFGHRPDAAAVNRPPGFLGVMHQTAPGGGCHIQQVVAGTAADEAGLQAGDRIARIGTREISSSDDLIRAAGLWRAGDEIEVLIERAGQEKKFKVKLRMVPGDADE